MIPNLKFEGAKEMDAALMELSGAVAVKVVRQSLVESLKPVADSAKGRAPQDEGKLERSIGVGTRLTRRQRKLRQPIVSAGGVEAYVGPGVVGGRYDGRHGHLQEFGTVNHGPQPFMRPAWISNLQAVFGTLAQSMTKNLARAVRAAQRKALKP